MPTTEQLEYEATIRDALRRRTGSTVLKETSQQGRLQNRKPDRTSFILSATRIRPDAEQVRQREKASDDPDIQQLAESIREYGLRNPVEVRWIEADDTYQIVSGERRFVATTRILGWTELPVRVVEATEDEIFWLQLHENIHRQDLHPLDLALALKQALDAGATLNEVAKRLCRSETLVQKASTIASRLTKEARALLLATPQLRSFELVYEIAKCPAAKQSEMIRRAADGGLSRGELRATVAESKDEEKPSRVVKRGGRPAKSRAFRKLISTETGAQVIVQFRKTKATTEEIIVALKEALRSLAA